ncbi:MAG: hypothetical protein WAO50_13035 [Candidatus Nanopelagicales bacterium]|jgi:hypothetical protein|nr:hypothetical protein [Actinomycetota bacterium]
MRRMVWVAIGAAGGIVAYRRIQQAMVDARERGVVLSAQQVGLSAVQAVSSARAIAMSAAAAAGQGRSQASAGDAAARVIEQAQAVVASGQKREK